MREHDNIIHAILDRNHNPFLLKFFNSQKKYFIEKSRNVFSLSDGNETDVYRWLISEAQHTIQKIMEMRCHFEQFKKEISPALSAEKKQAIILDFSWKLEQDKKRQKLCQQAFNHWYDENAQIERYLLLHHNACFTLRFLVSRIGAAFSSSVVDKKILSAFFNDIVFQNLQTINDEAVLVEFYQAIDTALHMDDIMNHALRDNMTAHAINVMHASRAISLLMTTIKFLLKTDVSVAQTVLNKIILHEDQAQYDIFLRRGLLEIYLTLVTLSMTVTDQLLKIQAPHVRQALTCIHPSQPVAINQYILQYFIYQENNPVLRASMLSHCISHASDSNYKIEILHGLVYALKNDTAYLPKKMALKNLMRCYDEQLIKHEEQRDFVTTLQECLVALKSSHLEPALKRLSAMLLEFTHLLQSHTERNYYAQLKNFIMQCPAGRTTTMPDNMILDDHEKMFRYMGIICDQSWPLDIQVKSARELIIFRGVQFRRKLWRFLHEFSHVSSEKRHDIPHTLARYYKGNICIASSLLYDVTKTRVPGEPVFNESDAGYHPFLPLADQFIPALIQKKSIHHYSPDGVVQLLFPTGFFQRCLMYLKLSISFSKVDSLRNVSYQQREAGNYLLYMKKMGIAIKFFPHQYAKNVVIHDESIMAFFQKVAP